MQYDQLKRREFITLIGGVAVAWPLTARAQQVERMPVIGSLNAASPLQWVNFMAGFRRGLENHGFIDGGNLRLEYRWANGRYEQLPALAADLVGRKVEVIFASGGVIAVEAAKLATTSIPIVFTTGLDPVRAGLVASLSRPGGNMTGVSLLADALASKRLELLREFVPKSHAMALLMNPNNPHDRPALDDTQKAASTQGVALRALTATSEVELEAAFGELATRKPDALLVSPDGFFNSRRDRIVAMAARLEVPTMYGWREYPVRGGLMSYGSSLVEQYRLAGDYVGRILKGAKPADLPVLQPTRFELVINLKTAKALGLDVPTSILLRADEVIE
jgi:putative ABC transport system substrate-binding protein